jgi:hypothetical protein
MLRHAIADLVSNAIKSASDGKIALLAPRDQDWLRIAMNDNAPHESPLHSSTHAQQGPYEEYFDAFRHRRISQQVALAAMLADQSRDRTLGQRPKCDFQRDSGRFIAGSGFTKRAKAAHQDGCGAPEVV